MPKDRNPDHEAMIHLARHLLEERARKDHPQDFYMQTCVVMGYDPMDLGPIWTGHDATIAPAITMGC